MAADEAANSKPEKLLTNLHNSLKSRDESSPSRVPSRLTRVIFLRSRDADEESDNEGHF